MINNFNNSLNDKQKAAAEAPLKPLLIVAGAGTGKTQTLTNRLIYVLKQLPAVDTNVVAITFTNKAANEMKSRIARSKVDLFGRSVFVGTFHSFGAKLLRREGKILGRGPDFTIFDDSDSLSLIKKIIKNLNLKKKISPAEIQNQISLVKNNLIAADGANFDNQEVFENIFDEYESKLLENNAFDFDDLIEKPVLIFNQNPAVADKYKKEISHILIDEYQDINKAQYALVKILAGKEGRISAVGDDQQAIYSWRGANFEFFLNFEKDWPESQIFVLDQNYRSTGNIINAASRIISNNVNQKPKNLWTEKDLGKTIEIVETSGANEEAEWIAGKLSGENDFKETAVLYRTNAQSRAIEEALINNGVPYKIVGGLKFYERREIKDVVAALRMYSNPSDSVSSDRLEKLLGKNKFFIFKTKWLESANSKKEKPVDLINKFLASVGYFDYLKDSFSNAEERKENIMELIGFASEFSDAAAFLERLALFEANDSGQKNEDAVRLTTIHLAKGLEFNKVFIAGCAEGLLPHARSISSLSETEEERRLMYVAMTRAKNDLYVSFYGIPSRFISEIPSDLAYFRSLNPNHNFSDFESFKNRDDEEDYIDY
ncbi:MAG: UvrD-helicase domain-containing protein [Patescibacteria group bacterium]|nr:UvrD-helicase domain-containing protein [Patescibacteria group bacterium]